MTDLMPYVTPSGEKLTHTYTFRVPDSLADSVAELLSAIAPLGFKSDGDVCRLALAEFIEKYKDQASNTNRAKLLSSVSVISRMAQEEESLEATLTKAGVSQIRKYIDMGMREAALEEKKKVYTIIERLSNENFKTYLKLKISGMIQGLDLLDEVKDIVNVADSRS